MMSDSVSPPHFAHLPLRLPLPPVRRSTNTEHPYATNRYRIATPDTARGAVPQTCITGRTHDFVPLVTSQKSGRPTAARASFGSSDE